MRLLVLFVFLVMRACPSVASEVHGLAAITDGDTVVVAGKKIRLNGIDAPETDQVCLTVKDEFWSCGVAARDALIAKTKGLIWSCDLTGTDRYGRFLGTCFVEGDDINRWMVQEGWALAFTRYSQVYVDDQERANDQEKGLWAGAFIPPWDWRDRNCETIVYGGRSVSLEGHRKLCGSPSIPPNPACLIKANLKPAECIYHVPGGKSYGKLDMAVAKRRWFCTEVEAEAAGCRKAFR